MDQDGKNQLGNAVGCLFTTSQDTYQTSGRTDREETDLQAEKTTHSYEGSQVTNVSFSPAQDDLTAGRLVRLLPDWQLRSITLHAAYPDRRHLSAKIRSFIDFLVEKAKTVEGD